MNERGQVTIFIIVAVVVIAAVALFFTSRGTLRGDQTYSPEVASITNFVDECLYDVSEEVIYKVGQGGGYYSSPVKSTKTGITYYLIGNVSYVPSKEDIENEISKSVSRNLIICLEDFESFPEYEISNGKIITKTRIESERVSVDVNYPLTIIKGESKSIIKDFEVEIPLRLGIIYSSVEEIITFGNEGIYPFHLQDVSEINDLFINTLDDLDEEAVIFIITDENSIMDGKPLEWVFANKYAPIEAEEI